MMIKVALLGALFVLSRCTNGETFCPVTEQKVGPLGNVTLPYYDNTLEPASIGAGRINWMNKLDDSLKIQELTIPGTHQSFTNQFSPNWDTQQCNTWSVSTQLKSGLRFFDIRLGQYFDELRVFHGNIYQHICFDNIIEDIVDFLDKNPSEFIGMRVVKYSHEQGNNQTFTEVMEALLGGFDQNRFWKQGEFPATLKDARGKIMILKKWPGSEDMWGFDWEYKQKIADYWSIEEDADLENKWTGIKEQLDEAANRTNNEDLLYITFLTGNGEEFTPAKVAKDMNERFYKYMPGLASPSTRGVILMDYPADEIIGDIIAFNPINTSSKAKTSISFIVTLFLLAVSMYM